MTFADPSTEPTCPNPPRFWWTKRIPIVATIIIAVLAIGWKFWEREARRRVEAEVAAIQARGEPILLQDFNVAAVPDGSNAAVSLNAAITVMPPGWSNFISSNILTRQGSPLDAATLKMSDQLIKASAPSRNFMRLARSQPNVVWSANVISSTPRFASHSELARLMAANVLYEHVSGHDAEAIELLRDMLHHADALEQPRQELIMHLLSMVIGIVTFTEADEIIPDLQVLPDSSATTQPTGPASRQQIRALIAELLSDDAMRQGLGRGMQAERASRYSVISPASSTPRATVMASLPMVFRTQLTWPWLTMRVLHLMQVEGDYSAIASAPNYGTARSMETKVEQHISGKTDLSRTIESMGGLPPLSMFSRIDQHYLVLARRRATAIRLAIRLYQLDHDGAYPAKLEDLVGSYLPKLPADPFASGEKPFKYKLSPQPMIYSVGDNQVDNGGIEPADIVYRLTKPAPPATTNTGSGS